MAVKKTKEKKVVPVEEVVKVEKNNKFMTAAWTVLLIGGLAHMMPTQMAPILSYAVYGVTVQMVVGMLSVVAALYYLLEE